MTTVSSRSSLRACLSLAVLLPTMVGAAWDIRAALIGDFGQRDGSSKLSGEELVAEFVTKTIKPDFIVSLGDNNYPVGAMSTMDENVGAFYSEWIYPFRGNTSKYPGGTASRFLPVPGNHDGYTTTYGVRAWPYLNYFSEVPEMVNATNKTMALRYYDFQRGPVHFFMLNSNSWEEDGTSADSKQAQWVKERAAQSTSKYLVVVWHHPVYSNKGRVRAVLRWPFKEWGISLVMSGHNHCYEHIVMDDVHYTVNGLGGTPNLYNPTPGRFPIPGTEAFFSTTWGAQVLEANDDMMRLTFRSLLSRDTHEQHKGFYYDAITIYPRQARTTEAPVVSMTPPSTTGVPPATTTEAPTTGTPATMAPPTAELLPTNTTGVPTTGVVAGQAADSPPARQDASSNAGSGESEGLIGKSFGLGILVGCVSTVVLGSVFGLVCFLTSRLRRKPTEKAEEPCSTPV